jgi:integrase
MSLPAARHIESYLARPGTGQYLHITAVEASQLAATARSTETRLKVKLLWHLGCRASELIAIRVEDIDFERAVLKIRRLKRRKEFIQDVPLPPELAGELRLFARGWERRGRLFKGDRTSLFSLVQRLGLKALGRRISPKHFRHGKAYHLVKVKGVHPAIAARALGHASLGSILSYVHPTEQDLREALQD